MKLTAILLFAALMQVSAKTYSQVTLAEKNMPLQQVFTAIEKQTGYTFWYKQELLDNTGGIDIDVKDATLEMVLKIVFKDLPLTYSIVEKTVVVKQKPTPPPDLQSTAPSSFPPIDITGKVLDHEGNPLSGATVKVKGGRLVTTTNNEGVFSFIGLAEKTVLDISFVGFETQTLTVKSKNFITVNMKKSESPLDEVQVIAYGTTSKRLNTGNVTTVTAKEIEKQPVSNPLLALQGRVPGMEITQNNGLPGSGVTVRIRGQNSIENGNEPLYIIDGVPYSSQMLPGLLSILGNSGQGKGDVTGSPLSYLNPADIESIDVLKDGDATSIYGTRGANGVVLITTKKGKAGPMRVDFNIQQGWGKVTRFIPWLNTRQYLDMRYEALKNDGIEPSSLTPDGSNYDLTVWDTTRYTDWNKELIGGSARYSNIQFSLYGGSENVQYRIGYNYNKQTTVFPRSFGDPKGSLSFNINSSSNNRKLQAQLSGNYQVDNNVLPGYDLSSYTNLAPNAPALYNSDGTLNWETNTASGYPTWNNPLASLNSKYKRRVNNLVTNAMLSYQLLKNLQIKASAGFTSMQSNELSTNPASLYAPALIQFIERNASFSSTQSDSWIIEPQLNYQSRIGQATLNVLLGTTIQQNNSKGQAITGVGFNSDLVLEDIKAARSVQVQSSLEETYKYNAIFGRFNYNLRDKYLINLTTRRDGTSRFGPDRQFANFGAAGIGWIFSKENFISKNLLGLSFGKLRASYGITGSDQVGNYRFLNLYRYVNYTLPYQTSLLMDLDGLFNAELAWEETKKLEVGVELGFWEDKIFLSASYFNNHSSNQLTAYGLPTNVGSGGVVANLDAKVQNTGWEFVLNTINLKSRGLQWTSSVNISMPRNKLISLSPSAIGIDKRLVGESLSTKFVFGFAGVDPATGQYQFYDGKGGTTFQPDTAYDPVTNTLYSQHALNTTVQFFGGLQNSIIWKGFVLDFLLQFEKRAGETNQHGTYPGFFGSIQNQPISVLDRWQNTGDKAPVQRYNQDFSIYNSVEYLYASDGIWMDAYYVRLKNVSLSWQFPTAWKQKMHLQNARIFSQAQNMFVITNYKGSDPETRSLTSLPPLRVWTVGLQVTF